MQKAEWEKIQAERRVKSHTAPSACPVPTGCRNKRHSGLHPNTKVGGSLPHETNETSSRK